MGLDDVILTQCTTPGPNPAPTPGGGCTSKRAYASTTPGGKVNPADFFTYVPIVWIPPGVWHSTYDLDA